MLIVPTFNVGKERSFWFREKGMMRGDRIGIYFFVEGGFKWRDVKTIIKLLFRI